jgi:hypothetical protein
MRLSWLRSGVHQPYGVRPSPAPERLLRHALPRSCCGRVGAQAERPVGIPREERPVSYTHCGHCGRTLGGGALQRYCSVLCKSAEAKRLRKIRTAEDRLYGASIQQATFQLTDIECLRLEARIASQEHHVFDGKHGFAIKDPKTEQGSANANELHESWADRGAALDVWEIRRKDRLRYGGFVATQAWFELHYDVLDSIWLDQPRTDDPLEWRAFHRKTFGFEINELYNHETTPDGKLRSDLRLCP